MKLHTSASLAAGSGALVIAALGFGACASLGDLVGSADASANDATAGTDARTNDAGDASNVSTGDDGASDVGAVDANDAAVVNTFDASGLTFSSCLDLRTQYPSAPSGAYTLLIGTNAPFQVYCDMDDNGGGWTLVLKINGLSNLRAGITASNEQRFSYDDPLWTTPDLYPGDAGVNPPADLSMNAAKYASYSTVPFSSILGIMKSASGNTGTPLALDVSDQAHTASFVDLMEKTAANTLLGHPAGRNAWLAMTSPAASPQPLCNQEGINLNTTGVVKLRLGLVANDPTDAGGVCFEPDSYVGFGGIASTTGEDPCYPPSLGGSGATYIGSPAGSAGGGICSGSKVADGGSVVDPDVLNFGYLFVR